VRGDADRDQDFQSGEDTVHFRIKGLTAGPYRVRAALMYQTLSARFAADLFSSRGPASRWFEQAFAGAEHKTIELTRLEASVGP
jgi:hypothetical protein